MSGRHGAAGLFARGAAGVAPPSGRVPASQGDDQSDLKHEKPIPCLRPFPASFYLLMLLCVQEPSGRALCRRRQTVQDLQHQGLFWLHFTPHILTDSFVCARSYCT